MPVDDQVVATELRQEERPPVAPGWTPQLENIAMPTTEIAATLVVPAGRRVYQPGRIGDPHHGLDSVGLILTPSLVEDRPADHAGMGAQ